MVFESVHRSLKTLRMMLVVPLSMMFYFRHSLFDCLKYTKKDNLLKIFSLWLFFKSAKEFRFLAFIKINIYTTERNLFKLLVFAHSQAVEDCALYVDFNYIVKFREHTSMLHRTLKLLWLSHWVTTLGRFLADSSTGSSEDKVNSMATTDHVLTAALIFPSL